MEETTVIKYQIIILIFMIVFCDTIALCIVLTMAIGWLSDYYSLFFFTFLYIWFYSQSFFVVCKIEQIFFFLFLCTYFFLITFYRKFLVNKLCLFLVMGVMKLGEKPIKYFFFFSEKGYVTITN